MPPLDTGHPGLSLSRVTYAPRFLDKGRQVFSLDTGDDADYACFAIWHGARARQDEIIADLGREFELIGDFEITWSQARYHRNIARLYERPGGSGPFTGWDAKIGPPPFRFLILRDRAPVYGWKRSVSGMIEMSNDRVTTAKYRCRALFDRPFEVHASNHLTEFLIQSVLVLGAERLQRVLAASGCICETLHKDLEGAEGWRDWPHLFSVLNIGTRYLILRGWQGLPERLADADIDLLCDNFQRLASAANVHQSGNRPWKGVMTVGESRIAVDIRFVGDGYYPALWQQDMLARRQLQDGFHVPAPDDLFFSLLYHCKVRKPSVKPAHRAELVRLAQELRFDWFEPAALDDDARCAGMLRGYMLARGLHYERPLDRGVQANRAVIRALPHSPLEPRGHRPGPRPLLRKLARAIRDPAAAAAYLRRRLAIAPGR